MVDMDSQPLVSVIVVTLDNIHLLKRCLTSLDGQSYKNVEVIVVDNGSTENIKSLLDWDFPEAVYVRLPENRGFAGGNNAGFAKARGQYVALINNDAVASPGWIESMLNAALPDPKIGMVASVVVDGNDRQSLDSIGLGVAFDGMSRQAFRGKPIPQLSAPMEVLMPSGCACMYRASALKEAGFFDEDFFAYCEDSDLGLRLRFAGWKAAAAPGAVVTHYYSMTMGRYSSRKLYLVERNRFWVAVKNFPAVALPLVPFVTLWRYLLTVFLLAGRGSSAAGATSDNGVLPLLSAIMRANVDMMIKLPKMLKKRASNRKLKRVGTLAQLSLMRKFRLPMRRIMGEK
ncbi:MAG: glycosyltransferase family 2 protein [Nitrospinota bacterium]